MKKHAYLIMAHNNWPILEKLIKLLDSENNDIYLHIDKKAVGFNPQILQNVIKSKIVLVESHSVFWADFSMVEVTIELLKKAKENGNYSYYHLLSGTDLLLKSQEEIYHFFQNSGKEFIGIVPNEVWYSVRRVKYYHPFLHNKYYRDCKLLKILDRVFEYVQRICGVNRIKEFDGKIIDGWQWFSITDNFAMYVLKKEDEIRRMFSKTIASDELFMQTLIYNSEYKENLYDMTDLKNGSMRYIDWERGKPYTWGAEEDDFKMLITSPYMFARKFDESHMDLVDKIYDEIDRRNKNDK